MADRIDLFVIGGGINGAAVARDAVGRGLSVELAEKSDYGHATSSASSKLIHGGLRYLEQYEFALVRESLREREVLLRIAPHLVSPLRFLLPIMVDQPRPAWTVRAGLTIYDLLAGRGSLPRSGQLSRHAAATLPLAQGGVTSVLHYHDCAADDSRLVLATLLDARKRGARIANYTEVLSVASISDGYRVITQGPGGQRETMARFVVNAGGPWASHIAGRVAGAAPPVGVKLVRGSHIVLPMPQPQADAYLLQNPDRRITMVLPWLGRFLMVGSTDRAQVDPDTVECAPDEAEALLARYNEAFGTALTEADILWRFAGARPLVDDGNATLSQVTRGYRLVGARHATGGLVHVFGGKLTTHRTLALHVMTELAAMGCSMGPPWTAKAPLHGGAMTADELTALADRPSPIAPATRRRWTRTYGSVAADLLDVAARDAHAAEEVANGIPRIELAHARGAEEARGADDFLRRRTKLFMLLPQAEQDKVARWFEQAST